MRESNVGKGGPAAHRSGGGVAAKMREQLGIQEGVRKRNRFVPDLDGNERAQEVRKSLGNQGPRTVAFAAALQQYRAQLESRRQDGVPLDQILSTQEQIEAAIAGVTPTKPDVSDQPTLSGPSGTGGRSAITPDSIPSGRGHGEGKVEVVRKSARDLVEKAADSFGWDEVDPLQVLAAAQARLLDTFRKAMGRDPAAEDSGYWSAYEALIAAVRAEMDRQGV